MLVVKAKLSDLTGNDVVDLHWGRNECVTNEPQRTSAGRLVDLVIKKYFGKE